MEGVGKWWAAALDLMVGIILLDIGSRTPFFPFRAIL